MFKRLIIIIATLSPIILLASTTLIAPLSTGCGGGDTTATSSGTDDQGIKDKGLKPDSVKAPDGQQADSQKDGTSVDSKTGDGTTGDMKPDQSYSSFSPEHNMEGWRLP